VVEAVMPLAARVLVVYFKALILYQMDKQFL
jgi:hypothetical protein